MLKHLSIAGIALSLSILTGCHSHKSPSTTGEQWPMSGGPDGNWQVSTSASVPTEWSVRKDENIKWKKSLPAGGQSGIAVWDDKLFLTINPPQATPPFAELSENYQALKTSYEQQYAAAYQALETNHRQKLDATFAAKKSANANWEQFLKGNADYQKLHGGAKNRLQVNLLKKSDEGRAKVAADKAFIDLVHTSSKGLADFNRRMLEAERATKQGASSPDIVLYCLDANTGETLWNRTVSGTYSSGYNYGFSDATTPCPATDGQYVWAINASGGMACFTMDGAAVWQRTWEPTSGRPFNKQFDSILYGDWVLNVEPPLATDSELNPLWNYLHAFDKRTGERAWVTSDALTHYNTPILGETVDGTAAVMIGRGGPHGVPERPVGLSLISLEGETAGTALWHWEPEDGNGDSGWGALSTQHWSPDTVSWFYKSEHLTVDAKTGESLGRHSLYPMNQHHYDVAQQKYVLLEDSRPPKAENQRHCNVLVGDHLYYMVRYAPFIARHNVKTGENVIVEVPREFDSNGAPVWGEPQSNDGLNARGQRHGADARTRGDGFQKCFLGSPTIINDLIYFTNALGMVYVIDSTVETFDADAIVAMNDLGQRGETLTYNSLSYANGHIYHRTLKEVICIGE